MVITFSVSNGGCATVVEIIKARVGAGVGAEAPGQVMLVVLDLHVLGIELEQPPPLGLWKTKQVAHIVSRVPSPRASLGDVGVRPPAAA